jgi:uncharacterized protein (TIGR03435 family)
MVCKRCLPTGGLWPLLVVVLITGLAAQSQEPIVRPAVEFNGASIRPTKIPGWSYDVSDNGNVSLRGFDVRMLIRDAFDLRHFKQIKEGPAWLSSESFEIRAIAGQKVPRDQVWVMMQSLLIDRFKLRAHWEIRDEPVYSLELTRPDGTLKSGLRRSKADCNALWESGKKGNEPDAPRDDKGQPICFRSGINVAWRLDWGGMPWADLFPDLAMRAEAIGGLDRPVVDNTGLSGNFDIHLEFRNELGGLPSTLTELALPSVKDAVQEQLGLKFVSKTEPWRVLVIDSIELPTPD